MSVKKILAKIDFFSQLDKVQIDEVAQHFVQVSYKAGSCIFREGDIGNKFYIVKSGKVEITKKISDELDTEAELQSFDNLDYFGEMSLIDNNPRSASAKALTDVELLYIGKEDFLSISVSNPSIIFQLIRTMSYRLRHTNEQVESMLGNIL
ncbi:MAG: cyclic nucleotide-binding domain-containing protein, partial [Candidatus Cloacimonetes bacterium]|nr:cyclic nucleotide-binding domain-containing protein [Candidatus Cloacimonadota bacterium]